MWEDVLVHQLAVRVGQAPNRAAVADVAGHMGVDAVEGVVDGDHQHIAALQRIEHAPSAPDCDGVEQVLPVLGVQHRPGACAYRDVHDDGRRQGFAGSRRRRESF